MRVFYVAVSFLLLSFFLSSTVLPCSTGKCAELIGDTDCKTLQFQVITVYDGDDEEHLSRLSDLYDWDGATTALGFDLGLNFSGDVLVLVDLSTSETLKIPTSEMTKKDGACTVVLYRDFKKNPAFDN